MFPVPQIGINQLGFRRLHLVFIHQFKKRMLSALLTLLMCLGKVKGFIKNGIKFSTVGLHRVKGTTMGEGFQHPAVETVEVHGFQEIQEIDKFSFLFSDIDDGINRVSPYIFHCVQAEAHRFHTCLAS